MARWERTASHIPPEPSAVLSLKLLDPGDQSLSRSLFRLLVSFFLEKVNLLQTQFFSEPNSVNLSNILSDLSRDDEELWWEIIQKEIAQVILSLSNRKILEITEVLNSFLKVMNPQLAAALALITQVRLDWEYYSQIFKTARMIALQKSEKDDYQTSKFWWLIALLETLEKMIETIIATCIQDFAESMNLLPETQMRAWQGWSTETAVTELLIWVQAA